MGKIALAMAGVIACVPLGGCCSIVAEWQDEMQVNTNPQGAEVSITDEDGQEVWHGVSPAKVTLKSGAGYFDGATYTVKAVKAGYADSVIVLDTEICDWYWGNILFGGVIGFFVLDPANGSMWDFDPPQLPEIDLAPAPDVAPAVAPVAVP